MADRWIDLRRAIATEDFEAFIATAAPVDVGDLLADRDALAVALERAVNDLRTWQACYPTNEVTAEVIALSERALGEVVG